MRNFKNTHKQHWFSGCACLPNERIAVAGEGDICDASLRRSGAVVTRQRGMLAPSIQFK